MEKMTTEFKALRDLVDVIEFALIRDQILGSTAFAKAKATLAKPALAPPAEGYVLLENKPCDCKGHGQIVGHGCAPCGHRMHIEGKCTGNKYQGGIHRKDGTIWVRRQAL